MSRFYTNVAVVGSNVLVREVVDGIPNMRKHAWNPTVYVGGKSGETPFTSLYGKPVFAVNPGTIPETRAFVEQYDGVQGFEIFGQLNWALQYMHEYKPTAWQYKLISAWSLDIETKVPEDENGKTRFPVPESADGEILLITMVNMHSGESFTWGTKPYAGQDTHYTLCPDEYSLIKLFISFWEQKKVDIITGWNVEQFDLPYLYNRIVRIVGDEAVKRLSPWGRISYKNKLYLGRLEHTTRIDGVSVLDYIDLYKKYILVKQESYSLGHIAMAELGHTKVDHSEFGTFNEFWQKAWDKFVHYNIVDTQLVRQLDNKLKLIELVLTMAYESHLNYEDVSSPVKLWDAIISNHCIDMNVALPQQKREKITAHLDGAYVKEPVPGWYHNVVSLDATSLYPSIIMTNNISPETYVGNCGLNIDDFLANIDVDVEDQYIVTPAGAIYSKDVYGVLPTLVEKFMKMRKAAKTEMLQLEQVYEDTKDETLINKIAALDSKQQAFKVALNSLYGATANEYFRFFKHDHAASITLTGQYVLRTVEDKIDAALNELFKTKGLKYLIYIDTDSLYFTLDKLFEQYNITETAAIKAIEKIAKDKITPLVNQFCNECCEKMRSYSNRLSFKLEIAADKAIWLGKKKYAVRAHSSEGVTFAKPKFKVKGLEMVRSSTPQFVRDKLKNALDIIFDKDEKATQEYIQEVRTEFMKLPYQQVAFPRGANNLVEYSDATTIYKTGKGESTPIQVRAALLYNHYLKQHQLDGVYPSIGEGEKIKFMYLKKPNKIRENVIAFPAEGKIPDEFGIIANVDYEEQFNKTFLASMEIILTAIKWNAEETSSLEEFFG
jgi:DNA polymerase elongation subunit (family B)